MANSDSGETYAAAAPPLTTSRQEPEPEQDPESDPQPEPEAEPEPEPVPPPPAPLLPLPGYNNSLTVILRQKHVRELQTIIRDKATSRSDFKFSADRLIRLVVEEGLNLLPYTPATVMTPTGHQYSGLRYQRANCGVSIVRSGEAMEQGLRDCCRSIRIGKILVSSDMDTHEARVVYAKFPEDVWKRKVLLMYPIMNTGNTIVRALHVMKEHDIKEENVILLTLFCTPEAARLVTSSFPQLRILTSEMHEVTPNHFGQKYFGTD